MTARRADASAPRGAFMRIITVSPFMAYGSGRVDGGNRYRVHYSTRQHFAVRNGRRAPAGRYARGAMFLAA